MPYLTELYVLYVCVYEKVQLIIANMQHFHDKRNKQVKDERKWRDS